MLLIVYLGYYILRRQEAERDHLKALAKAKPKSFSPSSSSSSNKDKKPLSSSDVRDGKLTTPSNKRVGDPMPKHVSGSSKEDPSAQSFRKNYFLTMQGPGRPALVPFQDGLRPKKGEAAGTMWWDNVPDGKDGISSWSDRSVCATAEMKIWKTRKISWPLLLTRTNLKPV